MKLEPIFVWPRVCVGKGNQPGLQIPDRKSTGRVVAGRPGGWGGGGGGRAGEYGVGKHVGVQGVAPRYLTLR